CYADQREPTIPGPQDQGPLAIVGDDGRRICPALNGGNEYASGHETLPWQLEWGSRRQRSRQQNQLHLSISSASVTRAVNVPFASFASISSPTFTCPESVTRLPSERRLTTANPRLSVASGLTAFRVRMARSSRCAARETHCLVAP